jgi:hypothetical protein
LLQLRVNVPYLLCGKLDKGWRRLSPNPRKRSHEQAGTDERHEIQRHRRNRLLTREGDVLLVPISIKQSCVSQAVSKTELESPVFLVATVDESIKSGRWELVGNRNPSRDLPIPAFKVQVGLGGDCYLRNFRGEIGRKASLEEVQMLRSHKSYSPGLVEYALRAYRDLEPWQSIFDEMRADRNQHVGDIFSS